MKKPTVSPDLSSAITTDRARLYGIITSPEGKRNPDMALQLAFHSDVSLDAAIGLLRSAPASNPYLEAMNREVGATGITPGGKAATLSGREARVAEIAESMRFYNETRYPKPRS